MGAQGKVSGDLEILKRSLGRELDPGLHSIPLPLPERCVEGTICPLPPFIQLSGDKKQANNQKPQTQTSAYCAVMVPDTLISQENNF